MIWNLIINWDAIWLIHVKRELFISNSNFELRHFQNKIIDTDRRKVRWFVLFGIFNCVNKLTRTMTTIIRQILSMYYFIATIEIYHSCYIKMWISCKFNQSMKRLIHFIYLILLRWQNTSSESLIHFNSQSLIRAYIQVAYICEQSRGCKLIHHISFRTWKKSIAIKLSIFMYYAVTCGKKRALIKINII